MLYRPNEIQPDEQTLKERLVPLLKEWSQPLLLIGAFLIFNFFFPRYAVEGASMEPQLHDTDRLLGSHLPVMTGEIERGEVVVLSSPVDGTRVVKRVIGLPGETVVVTGGVVFINSEPLDEPYIMEAPRYAGTWQLGDNQYFVLGDNRNHSYDSADYGPVDADLLQGVIEFRWWPPDALGGFPIPSYSDLR